MPWGRGSTRESRRTRELVLARDNHECQIRGPNCTAVATEDDHILNVGAGGTDALTNRRAACHACHREKSNREARAAKTIKNSKRPKSRHPGEGGG